jgi:microcystin-dependent protein
MYHSIDFTELGGFPLTQDTMEFLQESYNDVFGVLTGIAGKYIILTGVTEVTPNNYSNGWLIIDGEIVPFIGGLGQPSIIVDQTTENYTFRNNIIRPVIIQRVARFALSGGTAFSSFNRLSLTSLKTYIDNVNTIANNAQTTANTALAAVGTFSAGMIMMWAGNPGSVPTGWRLCDGLDGRPNLKGRFIVGYDGGDGDYDTIGKNGGTKTVALNITEMPSHSHSMTTAGNHQHYVKEVVAGDEGSQGTDNSVGSWDETGTQKFTSFAGDHTHTIDSTGGGDAHENRPPYYTLAYIIKV